MNELARFQEALDTPGEGPLPMLFFYGVAGAGKSWLKRRMFALLKESKAVPFASIDFDTQQGFNAFKDDLRATLFEITKQLGVVCPYFEMAFHVFNVKTGHPTADPAQADSDSLTADFSETALSDLLGEVLHDIPVAGTVAKALCLLGKRLLLPERQKVFREWLKTESGREDLVWLEAASPQEISKDLCRRLALDLLLRLPRRENRACRAVVLLDTWEHVQRGKAAGLQHFTDSEKWVTLLYGAAQSVNAQSEAFPFLQIVVFGRDRATWAEYDPDLRDNNVLEQKLIGGLAEADAREFLAKCQITEGRLQDAILKASAEAFNGGGAAAFHAFNLGLCADTVYAERQRGPKPAPESFVLSPDKKFALTDRFLQSLDEEGRLRITRLSLTPRFDDLALRAVCETGNVDQTDLLCRDVKSYTFVQPAEQTGWFVLHSLMKLSLRARAETEGEEKNRERHQFWRQYWQGRSAEKTDLFAGLAWFHHWHLDAQTALADWNQAAENARAKVDFVGHRHLLDWWDALGIEQKKGLTLFEAQALNSLGTEFARASLGLPQENLSHAVAAYRSALEVDIRAQLPQQWAGTQNNLGLALQEQGIRTDGEESARLLGDAVTAYRSALEVLTRAQLPQQWAMTQNNLGIALKEQGIRTDGEEGARLLGDAVTAYRSALEVRTRAQLPQDWAASQNNLGNALKEQGIRIGGKEGARLLGEAVTAYRSALEVYTRAQLPQDWAMTQNNLGAALKEQGIRTDGEEGARLLGDAVTAYRSALEVRTRAQLPQDWAMTQNNLGGTLQEQGTRTGGEEGARLLGDAVTAYRSALEVYTRAQLPQDWATTQNNLGNAMKEQAKRTMSNDKKKTKELLVDAIAAHQAALQVYTAEATPYYNSLVQKNLEAATALLSDLGGSN